MTREQLEHAIRAACDVARDSEVYVFGSQAILGQYPDAPESLKASAEADIVPRNFPDRWEAIDGALGELSPFHTTFGFYVQGVSMDTAVLSAGWQRRCYRLKNQNTRQNTGWCLEGHDLAASKLVASRTKDFEFVRILLKEKMISRRILLERVANLPIDAERRSQLAEWVSATSDELGRR